MRLPVQLQRAMAAEAEAAREARAKVRQPTAFKYSLSYFSYRLLSVIFYFKNISTFPELLAVGFAQN